MSRVESPTIVVALGAFGAEVSDRLGRLTSARTVVLELEHGESADAVARVVDAAESLLGLRGLLETRGPGDGRRPELDVFWVGDLGEAAVADALPELLLQVGRRLLSRFSHIFRGHDLAGLTLSPVLALTGARTEPSPAALLALERIEREATAPAGTGGPGHAPPLPRVFLVEQQSSRYELSRGELVSTVVSFMSLLLGTSLRNEEPLSSFLRSPHDQRRDRRLFASFGCATLEMTLRQYCVARGAADVVEAMRQMPAAGASAGAARAARLVPDVDELEARLSKSETGEDLIEILRAQAPVIDFPAISATHTPEQVRDVAYGWSWYETLEGTVEALVRELDDVQMDELARLADERGLVLGRRLVSDMRATLRELERSGPQGWALALRLAEQVEKKVDRSIAALDRTLRSRELPPFPKPGGVESAFLALREESTRRPRPFRLWVFGAVAAGLGAVFLQHVPKWVAVALFGRQVPLMSMAPSSGEIAVSGPLHYVLDPPYSFFWVLALLAALIGWLLSRYRQKRHRALLDARDGLRHAVARFLTDAVSPSILGYYEARLRFVLRSWVLRALCRLRDATGREIERLGGISAALGQLARRFEQDAERFEAAPVVGESGDLLYRTRADPELLTKTYDAVRPGPDVAEHLFKASLGDGDDDEAPSYLLFDNVVATVEPHVAPSDAVLRDHAGPFVANFVRELHGKLSVPLEVQGFDDRAEEREYLFAPEWAEEPLAELRAAMRSLPATSRHADADRVHLLAVRTALAREQITVLRKGD